LLEVIGGIGDIRSSGLDGGAAYEVCYPLTQRPQGAMCVAARALSTTAALAPSVRCAVMSGDSPLSGSGLSTMDGIVARSVAARRFTTQLFSLLGATGLLLAAVGI
jgi:hypothetical protein